MAAKSDHFVNLIPYKYRECLTSICYQTKIHINGVCLHVSVQIHSLSWLHIKCPFNIHEGVHSQNIGLKNWIVKLNRLQV
jgi:hypothetical protein